MKTIKREKGFSAYEQINALANLIYKGQDVRVQASIFGDEYIILVDNKEILKGTTEAVRNALNAVAS